MVADEVSTTRMSGEEKDFKVEELRGPLVDKFVKANRQTYTDGVVRIWPSGATMTRDFPNHIARIRRLAVRPDDVWIVTHPKCGTTWTQEMVWLLLNNLDYRTARTVPQYVRSPFMEFGCRDPPSERAELQIGDAVQDVENLKSPRCIKTHLYPQLLPQQIWTVKPKLIYVARNPKDVVVSWYHHHRLLNGYTGSCEEFVEAFMGGIVEFGPFWEHVLEFWKIRDEPNVLFNTYEEMKKDLAGVILRTAKFLNCTLDSDQLKDLCEHLSFESMRNNPCVVNQDDLNLRKHRDVIGDVQPLIRKGKVGGWKEDMTPYLANEMDRWTMEKLKGTDFVVPS
ncbi:luciferin sulfotransferase-like isoform X2 [Periplaneta americana]|uniref:luciferin sulfotransferase-like isoform X2 n=1 Tax=Periplaneta americana TaxID=6978 RepID=UPI0037E80A5E